MEELEIVLEVEGNIEEEIELINEGKLVYPALENLVVTPSLEKQVFNHENSYGYDEVTVEAAPSENLEITPSAETQVNEGLYNKVIVLGDDDLLSSNIKQGVEIFGVAGNVEELTEEMKDSIDDQEELTTTQEETIEQINQTIQNKILIKEKYKPRYAYISFENYTGTELDYEISMLDTAYLTNTNSMFKNCDNLTSLDLSNFNTSNVTDMGSMFQQCLGLTKLDLSNFDTSKVANMNQLFYGCKNLTSLDLSNFDTSNVTNMSTMFYNCTGLTELDLSSFDTSNVNSMLNIFLNCANLTSLDLSNFRTSNVTSMNGMFRNCSNLTSIDASNFDTSNVTNMNQLFYACSKLTYLDIRNFTFDKVTSYANMLTNVPKDCLIIVKGDTEKQWLLAKRSDLTNIKAVAELEV